MSGKRPSKSTLDQMVLGTDDGSGWTDLVSSPTAARDWDQAVRRRQRIDAIARLVRGRPWLATLLHSARRLARGSAPLPHATPTANLGSMLTATLGRPTQVDLVWGDVVPVEVGHGERVTFAGAIHGAFYMDGAGRPQSFDGRWDADANDGETLIIVPARAIEDLDDAEAEAVALAFVLLSVRSEESAD